MARPFHAGRLVPGSMRWCCRSTGPDPRRAGSRGARGDRAGAEPERARRFARGVSAGSRSTCQPAARGRRRPPGRRHPGSRTRRRRPRRAARRRARRRRGPCRCRRGPGARPAGSRTAETSRSSSMPPQPGRSARSTRRRSASAAGADRRRSGRSRGRSPPRSSASSTVGSNRPAVARQAATASSITANVSAETTTGAPAAAFSRQSSLVGHEARPAGLEVGEPPPGAIGKIGSGRRARAGARCCPCTRTSCPTTTGRGLHQLPPVTGGGGGVAEATSGRVASSRVARSGSVAGGAVAGGAVGAGPAGAGRGRDRAGCRRARGGHGRVPAHAASPAGRRAGRGARSSAARWPGRPRRVRRGRRAGGWPGRARGRDRRRVPRHGGRDERRGRRRARPRR